MCIRDRDSNGKSQLVHTLNGSSLALPRIIACLLENNQFGGCLLYTSDAADERSSVDLGGRRIIKKKKQVEH